jgi:hypothetical protein
MFQWVVLSDQFLPTILPAIGVPQGSLFLASYQHKLA